ncbi:Gfo/Idh/MocA family oxidoreductase [Paenibacillus sp. J5C_2022]|uniref:Gfo/Idh/MocA family protein n=1 Tax=Paenibacillus sp. J5C2022 TaxID=2977129 RepID=UPI0021CF7ECF|nr:Gfo/Idh/MocA family oxidoreductase [Paenibacillus sp. J5C2022]MCU6712563.1 Gfo/Idh/MocA family oxidoreductase [Paenibacillus sp. J5C2022]
MAVIGCGGMGRIHARAITDIEDVELVGVCDEHFETAQAVADQSGTEAFATFAEMMDRTNPDIVNICLPTHLHKKYTIEAAMRGKHVICEKPIANSLEDAKEMMEVCKQNGVRLFIGHAQRFIPYYKQMQEKIAAGAIGKVGVAHMRHLGAYPGLRKEWYADPQKSGGVIIDLMIHDIETLQSIMGEVESVYAVNKKTDKMDYALVTLRFKSGAIANMESFWGYSGHFTYGYEFAGSKGIIKFDSHDSATVFVRTPSSKGEPQLYLHDGFQYLEIKHFIACIQFNTEPIVTSEDGYRALETALAAYQSVETGEPVLITR